MSALAKTLAAGTHPTDLDRLRHLAAFDEMTGVTNRTQCQDRLIEQAKPGALTVHL